MPAPLFIILRQPYVEERAEFKAPELQHNGLHVAEQFTKLYLPPQDVDYQVYIAKGQCIWQSMKVFSLGNVKGHSSQVNTLASSNKLYLM